MNLTETDEVKLRKLTADGDSFKIKVPVLAAGVLNTNKRCYSLQVIKAAVNELKGRLAKRSTFGSTSHVKDMELDQVSHVVEDIELDDKGVANAVVRILGTTKGKNLTAILNGGGEVGVSARGIGETDERGNVKDGYRLLGVDFTLSPAFPFHVSKAAMFESAPLEENETDPAVLAAKGYATIEELNEAMKAGVITEADPEKILRLKYITARQAGFDGSAEDFRKTFDRSAEDSRAEQAFADAQKNAGYKGDFASFRKTLTKGK